MVELLVLTVLNSLLLTQEGRGKALPCVRHGNRVYHVRAVVAVQELLRQGSVQGRAAAAGCVPQAPPRAAGWLHGHDQGEG